jgi:hypothetical protein
MTMRERMLAVVRGRMPDRVPFVQYTGIAAPNEEIWSVIGRENMGLLRWSSVHKAETPNCRCDSEPIEVNGVRGVRNTLHTPRGSLWEERLFDPVLGSSASRRHYVQERDDYLIVKAYFEDMVISEDLDHFLRDERELGDDGIPHTSMMRSPYQQLWIQWVSLEELCIHMMDYPDLLDDVMSVIGRRLREIFEIVRKAPIPYIVFPDNITAPTIGERYFRRYTMPYYQELAEMLSDRDMPIYVHMDGDLKPLWTAIGESGVRGLDSMSPPPDNDTSAGDAVTQWPEMRVGLNFPSSIHLASPEVIRETADRILAEAGHTGRIQIQISENVPPGVWRKSYPIIAEAIREFGEV